MRPANSNGRRIHQCEHCNQCQMTIKVPDDCQSLDLCSTTSSQKPIR